MVTDADSVPERELVDELVELESPRGRTLPFRMRVFLPDPYMSFEQLLRLRCEDVWRLPVAEIRCELARMQGALASMSDSFDTPPWIWRRRNALLDRLRAVA